jgi:hypothetical protein
MSEANKRCAQQPPSLKSHGRPQAQREFEVKDGLRPPPEAAARRAVLVFNFSLRSHVAVRFKEESAFSGVFVDRRSRSNRRTTVAFARYRCRHCAEPGVF